MREDYPYALVTFLSKIREAINDYLEILKPGEVLVEELDPEDLAQIKWYTFQGKGEEALDDEAGWCFASDRDGSVYPACERIVEAILKSESGRVVVGAFEYSLGGKGKFLQRRPLKKEEPGR